MEYRRRTRQARIGAPGPGWVGRPRPRGDTRREAMATQRRVIYLTTGRGPTWLRVLLTLGALGAAVIAFWLGLVLALAVVATVALVLLPVLAWRAFSASRRPGGSATIDGEYTVASSSDVDVQDEPTEPKGREPPR
ncbi:MAG: hypothetical protein A3G25_05835 [Betaproteobacteria bacterium RIFCSPLOWO2_12_FULL_63_13]|nr:MAG: hypothetical protein A3G25_05835 [Betaproteobacteria bacterium RIFCSPLOWO2_12_FULL_63_13]